MLVGAIVFLVAGSVSVIVSGPMSVDSWLARRKSATTEKPNLLANRPM
jgi:hypothetical protein